jgi:outer membrane protein
MGNRLATTLAFSLALLDADALRAQFAPTPTPPPAPVASRDAAPLSLLQAVTTTLRRHPAIAAARSVAALAHAEVVAANGPFDVTLLAAAGHQHSVAPSFVTIPALQGRVDSTTLLLGATKTTHWGTRLDASVSMARLDAPDYPPLNQRAGVTLSVTQPLLRGAGSAGAASALHAAELSETARLAQQDQVAQQQAYAVIVAYWTLLAAERGQALFEASEARAARILDETRELVERDQQPRGDLRRLEAGLAARKRTVLESESARIRAIHALQLAMGLDRDDEQAWHPSDNFPAAGMPAASVDMLLQRALQRRVDLKAAKDSVFAAQASERGAEQNTLPKLDVSLSIGYGGGVARDGLPAFVSALASNVGGVNGGASINVELPVDNSAQRGLRMGAIAQRTAAEIARDDLARTLRNEIVTAYDELRFAVAALREAQSAQALYEQALEDERYKLRAGLSTVVDVVFTEDQLTQAARASVETALTLAAALARLQLALGALPAQSDGAGQALSLMMKGGGIDGS